MNMLRVSKLAKFFDREIKDAKKILIVSTNGAYELFGRFKIEPKNSHVAVVDFNTRTTLEFSSLQYAAAYCVLLEGESHVAARRVHLLDLKLSSLCLDMSVHRKMLKVSTSADSKLLYKIKLQEDSFRRKTVIQEINSYINNSKILQGKTFTTRKRKKF
jgi:hypothetical protein